MKAAGEPPAHNADAASPAPVGTPHGLKRSMVSYASADKIGQGLFGGVYKAGFTPPGLATSLLSRRCLAVAVAGRSI